MFDLIRLVIICVPHVPKGAQASLAVVAACGAYCMFGQHGSSEAASQPALDLFVLLTVLTAGCHQQCCL